MEQSRGERCSACVRERGARYGRVCTRDRDKPRRRGSCSEVHAKLEEQKVTAQRRLEDLEARTKHTGSRRCFLATVAVYGHQQLISGKLAAKCQADTLNFNQKTQGKLRQLRGAPCDISDDILSLLPHPFRTGCRLSPSSSGQWHQSWEGWPPTKATGSKPSRTIGTNSERTKSARKIKRRQAANLEMPGKTSTPSCTICGRNSCPETCWA